MKVYNSLIFLLRRHHITSAYSNVNKKWDMNVIEGSCYNLKADCFLDGSIN